MIQYAVAWNPGSDNLGDDLRVLAAARLLPRVDRVLDADCLDAPMPDLEKEDRVVTLLSGAILHQPAHWPPEEHVAPVCMGVHFSAEDAWGVSFSALSGTGKDYLQACAPIGCRDARTASRLAETGIPGQLTACLTLTLERRQETAERKIICCVDVPDSVSEALKEFAPGRGLQVRVSTHQLSSGETDFQRRMDHAAAVVEEYAGARFVVTRRLHCAMACLAVGTPVLLLYNSGYEDVTRFAPMDRLVRTRPVDEFVRDVRAHGLPQPWQNPSGVESWRERLTAAVRKGVAAAEQMPLPVVDPAAARRWREERLRISLRVAAEKIHRLEHERYEGLHEKFALLMKEDAAKSTLTTLLNEPEVTLALQKAANRRALSVLPWYKRPMLWWKLRRGEAETEDLLLLAEHTLQTLGWPEGR